MSCVTCGAEAELSPEGQCFKCSTGDDLEAAPREKNVRELLDGVARSLADKKDVSVGTAKTRMRDAVKGIKREVKS